MTTKPEIVSLIPGSFKPVKVEPITVPLRAKSERKGGEKLTYRAKKSNFLAFQSARSSILANLPVDQRKKLSRIPISLDNKTFNPEFLELALELEGYKRNPDKVTRSNDDQYWGIPATPIKAYGRIDESKPVRVKANQAKVTETLPPIMFPKCVLLALVKEYTELKQPTHEVWSERSRFLGFTAIEPDKHFNKVIWLSLDDPKLHKAVSNPDRLKAYLDDRLEMTLTASYKLLPIK